jgi:hypothetical protein
MAGAPLEPMQAPLYLRVELLEIQLKSAKPTAGLKLRLD